MHLKQRFKRYYVAGISVLLCTCNFARYNTGLCVHEPGCIPITVVHQGYHTLLRIPYAEAPVEITKNFGESTINRAWLHVGWGEEDFFQYDGFSPLLAAKALVCINKSVLRYSWSNASVQAEFGSSAPHCTIHVTRKQLQILFSSILDEQDTNRSSATFQSGNVVFVPSKMYYNGLHNCNYWTLLQLQRCGIPVKAGNTIFAEQVMYQLCATSEIHE